MDDLRRRVAEQYTRWNWNPRDRANLHLSSALIREIRQVARRTMIGNGGSPETVLDVGCGGGSPLRAVARELQARIAVGVDLHKRFEKLDPGFHFLLADGRHLPHGDDEFDLTLLMTVLSSVPSDTDRQRIVDETLRVTRVSGTVVVYDFMIKNPLNRYTRAVTMGEVARFMAGRARLSARRVMLDPFVVRLVFRLPVKRPDRWCEILSRLPLLRHHLLVEAVKLPAQVARSSVGDRAS